MEISAVTAVPALRPGPLSHTAGQIAKAAAAQLRVSGPDLPRQMPGAAEAPASKFPESFFRFLAESEPLNPIDTSAQTPPEEPVSTAESGYADAGTILGGGAETEPEAEAGTRAETGADEKPEEMTRSDTEMAETG